MKIFISWSGKRSLGVATTLRDWLPYLFNGIELFVSSEDIRKGKRWPAEVSKELDVSNFGIVCLTQDNLEAPWLLFESGALSKSVKEASVYTLLVGGLRATDIEGPLSHFQHTIFEKEDFFKLVKSINDAQAQGKQDEARLRRIFEKFWDELESTVAKIVNAKEDSKAEKKTRSVEDMFRELLELTTHIARNLPETRPDTHQPITVQEAEALLTDEEGIRRFGIAKAAKDGVLWKKLLEAIGKKSPFTVTYLQGAKIGRCLPDGTFMIYFPVEFADHISLVDNDKNHKLLRTTLAELGYTTPKIAFKVIPSPPETNLEKSE